MSREGGRLTVGDRVGVCVWGRESPLWARVRAQRRVEGGWRLYIREGIAAETRTPDRLSCRPVTRKQVPRTKALGFCISSAASCSSPAGAARDTHGADDTWHTVGGTGRHVTHAGTATRGTQWAARDTGRVGEKGRGCRGGVVARILAGLGACQGACVRAPRRVSLTEVGALKEHLLHLGHAVDARLERHGGVISMPRDQLRQAGPVEVGMGLEHLAHLLQAWQDTWTT
eukprot:2455437-Prymnesium_polylepis.4